MTTINAISYQQTSRNVHLASRPASGLATCSVALILALHSQGQQWPVYYSKHRQGDIQ